MQTNKRPNSIRPAGGPNGTAKRYLIFDDGVLPLTEAKDVFLGRDCHSCDIFFFDDRVSRKHARVFCRNGRFYVQDLDSMNGVHVSGKRVHGAVELVEGDLIELRPHEVMFVSESHFREMPAPKNIEDKNDQTMPVEVESASKQTTTPIDEPKPEDERKPDAIRVEPIAKRQQQKAVPTIRIVKKKRKVG